VFDDWIAANLENHSMATMDSRHPQQEKDADESVEPE
jgi:hypothetical protein